ncbi:hypothetical protein SAMN05444172_2302 [Burkholderia sp. GAS332]|nr:hypothetical protein SAMN05444172_2302 [Burkholderia sp. GAS332]
MKTMRWVMSSAVAAGIVVALAVTDPSAYAASESTSPTIELAVNPAEAGREIPEDFLGLSFESMAILKATDGSYQYLKPHNKPLSQLFHSLGVKSLRVGGNTADTPTVPLPTHEDIDALFAFADMAKVRVIYTLRMRGGDVNVATEPARYVAKHYGMLTDCLMIGNEPDVFEHHDYAAYSADFRRFLPAVMAAAPHANICGPSATDHDPTWAGKFAAEFGSMPQLKWVTQHLYPGKKATEIASVESARALLLNPDIDRKYEEFAAAFLPQVKATGAKFRMEETNSFSAAGVEGVSNTFTSTLWALGYLHWWLRSGADGLNFHTGVTTAAGDRQRPCWYAAFWAKPEGTTILPLAYAMKAFSIAAHGRELPVHAEHGSPDLEEFASLGADGTVVLTLVNRSFGDTSKDDSVAIRLPEGYSRAETLELRAPKGNIDATEGITLGGSAIGPDGAWNGHWKTEQVSGGQTQIVLPAASAVLVRLVRGS